MIVTGTTIAIVLCAVVILMTARRITHHPGHRVADRDRDAGMVSLGNDTEIIFSAPIYPVERPVEITVHDLPVVTDDFYEKDEDPAELERRFDESAKVLTTPPLPPEPEVGPDPDPEATGDWPTAIPPAGWTGMDYGDDLLEELDIDADQWLQPLQTGANGRAVRRLKSLMAERGWTERGQRETAPRSAGKRRKKRTLGRLNPVEAHRDRAHRRAANPDLSTGRHRRSDKNPPTAE